MGVLFAISDRRRNERGDLQGLLVLASACLIGSVLFTFVFSVSVNAINDLLNLTVPSDLLRDFTGNHEVVSQIVADFVLMMALSIRLYHVYHTLDLDKIVALAGREEQIRAL